MLTADHGSQFDPALTGAFRISQGELGEAIDDRFDYGDGVGVVEAVCHPARAGAGTPAPALSSPPS